VLGSFFAPFAIFDKFEFVRGIGFVFFGKIILGTADRADESQQYSWCFFRFGHVGSLSY